MRRMFYLNLSPEEIISARNKAVAQMNKLIAASSARDYALAHMFDKEEATSANEEEYAGYLLSYTEDVRS